MIRWNLDIETCSTCNRVCPTCLRNSYPDRDLASAWFEKSQLPADLIMNAIREAMEIDSFAGTVCLNHYNEPLQDERLPEICLEIKKFFNGQVYFHSNGDLLKEDVAKELDGVVDKIIFTLYMDDPVKTQRKEWINSLFEKTTIVFITEPIHLPTHYSPAYPVKEMARRHVNHTCFEPSMRIIINHRGDYLLCCDDMLGHFDLGSYPEISIRNHLERVAQIQADLSQPGGRLLYPHCMTCPRA